MPKTTVKAPSVRAVCRCVGYADEGLNDNTPPTLARKLEELKQWFHPRVCRLLGMPDNAEWMALFERVGILAEQYEQMEQAERQRLFREMEALVVEDTDASEMFERLEDVRFCITGRE